VKTHARQLVRFSAVSLFCFALGLGVLTGLHELAGVHYLVAYVASFVVTSSVKIENSTILSFWMLPIA